ncbi:TonB-dependent receptor [Parapedobacter pyrenivorans]|uniref:TonB-dependent receptor n=1 Tax=Parapedobacter pyrenivorans TaxID=1305674 RepID=A0A917HKN7_9SPHI|nr:TonB-dependent receptor [Parapedobacter pyrenivorans]GGG82153.1 TonB-dependent receptor [Parapedobacter pyrenivorans]
MSRLLFLVVVISCTTGGVIIASDVMSQHLREINITVGDDDSRSLGSLFRKVEQQSRFRFYYDKAVGEITGAGLGNIGETNLYELLERIAGDFNLKIAQNKHIIAVTKVIPQEPGRIIGRITDASTGEALAHATVQVQGSLAVTVADNRGHYRLNNVPVGRVELVVRYLGYVAQQVTASVQAGGSVQMNVSLAAQLTELEGITVEGIRRGEVKSLNTMKNAENIKYVLSQEQMERFPDNTVGEALQRVPGVAVEYSYGLARNVIIRGLSQDQGSVTLNGNRLPSTSAGYRTTDLNGILSNTVEAIEVIKTLTPDQDADGTAGAVNIITKTPPEYSRSMDAKASLGNNLLVGKNLYEVGLNYSERKTRWGYQLGANYMRSLRGEDRIQKSYGNYTVEGIDRENWLRVISLEDTQLKRDNLGIHAELNFFPNQDVHFYLRGNYNKYYEIQSRNNRNFVIGDYQSTDRVTGVTVEHGGNDRDYNRDLLMLSLGGKRNRGNWEMNGDLTYSRGLYDQPIYYNANFTRGGLSGAVDVSSLRTPMIALEGDDVYDPVAYTAREYVNRHDSSLDHDGQLTLNVIRSFRFSERDKGIIKFGGRFRYKYNERTRNYYRHVLKDGNFSLADFNTGIERDDYYQNKYNIGTFPDVEKMERYFRDNGDLFIDDETYTRQNTDPDSYTGTEYLGAAYAMTRFNVDKLEVTAGVRYEQTGFDYQGNEVILDEDGAYVRTNPVNTDKVFDGFFPSLNLKYALTPQTNLRAAATRSLSRPSYYDLVPWEEVLNRNQRVNKGNPDLQQSTATNLDFLFEHYFKKIGLVSGGAFYKRINDYIYSRSFQQVGGEYDGWRIDQAANGAAADVYGFELAWQQQLTFLPGFLNGFGIYANYTQIQSSFEVPGIEMDRTVRLPDMRPKVGNLALSYEKYGFSGRISAYFYETFTMELADTPNEDLIEAGRMQLDFSASQRINSKTKIFLGVSNLTNEPIRNYYGDGRPDNDRIYSVWGNIGIRYKPF